MLDQPPCTPPVALSPAECRRALVLAPHPDDEAIGCGGLLARLHDLGIATRVVLVSDGSGAGELPAGTDRVRQAEFSASLACLGEHLETELWQLPDGDLANVADLPERITATIEDFRATLLVAPWPGDLHPDHSALGRAALECHRRQPLAQGVLFYEVWSPLPATHLLEIDREWPRKQAALACHATALACGGYDRAMQGLASYRSLLGSGRAGLGAYAEAYHGLDLSDTAPGVQVRFALPGDGAAVASLFERAFASRPPQGWWAWKYAGQPHPGSLARDAGGRVVGFYGAQARQGLWRGEHLAVCQQGDVMVAPGYRFATRRQGVFSSISRLFLERLVGDGRPFALSYGFPTPRALALGRLLGLYRQGDDLQEWRAEVAPVGTGAGRRFELLAAAEVADWSWVETLPELPPKAAGCLRLVRSAAYWQHRYGEHPDAPYELLRVTLWGRLCAAAVLRRHGDRLEIIDVALRHRRHWPGLLALVHCAAERLACQQLLAWGTQTAIDDFPGGERHGAGSLALPGPWLAASLAERVSGHCWLLGGDTDFR